MNALEIATAVLLSELEAVEAAAPVSVVKYDSNVPKKAFCTRRAKDGTMVILGKSGPVWTVPVGMDYDAVIDQLCASYGPSELLDSDGLGR